MKSYKLRRFEAFKNAGLDDYSLVHFLPKDIIEKIWYIYAIKEFTDREIAMYGLLDVLVYKTRNNIPINNFGNRLVNNAARFGHIRMLRWLVNNGYELTNESICYAAVNSQLKTMKWIYQRKPEILKDDSNPHIHEFIIMYGNIEDFDWIMSVKNIKIDLEILKLTVIYKNFDIFKHIFSIYGIDLVRISVIYENFELFKNILFTLIRRYGIPWESNVLESHDFNEETIEGIIDIIERR